MELYWGSPERKFRFQAWKLGDALQKSHQMYVYMFWRDSPGGYGQLRTPERTWGSENMQEVLFLWTISLHIFNAQKQTNGLAGWFFH